MSQSALQQDTQTGITVSPDDLEPRTFHPPLLEASQRAPTEDLGNGYTRLANYQVRAYLGYLWAFDR